MSSNAHSSSFSHLLSINARQVLISGTDRLSKKYTSVYMVKSVYIRDKFATKEEKIKQVVNSQLNRIDTKIRELGTRIDDHGGQRIRNVGRPIAPSDASTKPYTDELNNENIALFANHFVESVVNGEDGQPMIDPIRKRLTDIASPIEQSDAANKEFVDGVRREVEAVSKAVEAAERNKNNMGGQVVTNVGHPTENNHAATKEYVGDELLFFDRFRVETKKSS